MVHIRLRAAAIVALLVLAPIATTVFAQDGAPAASTLPALTVTPFPGSVSPETVTSAMIGQDVVLTGTIARVVPSERDNVPFQLYLIDREEAPVMIVYWVDAAKEIHGNLGVPQAGTPVSVTGKLEEFRGRLQVRVRNAAQIRLAGYGAAAAAPVAGATDGDGIAKPNAQGYFTLEQLPGMQSYLARELSIMGKATGFRAAWSETAPHVITVSEGDHALEVVFWPGPGETYPDFSKPGTPIFATGQLQQYRDKLQLKVDDLANLSTEPLPSTRIVIPVIQSADGRSAADGWPGRIPGDEHLKVERMELPGGERVSLRSLGPEHDGNTVTVTGTVTGILGSGNQFSLLVGDARGFVRVNLPKNHKPVPGMGETITILGKVRYNQKRSSAEIELTPQDK